ncbi:hypothetical protein K5M35_03750, partial [Chromobacterium vaccinii]|nr:hypothetical protein [Chromobacterium vaccinii]
MQELSLDEVLECSGGRAITENQCIGVFTAVGGALGAWGGFYAAGVGALSGASFGMGAGGAAGLIICP